MRRKSRRLSARYDAAVESRYSHASNPRSARLRCRDHRFRRGRRHGDKSSRRSRRQRRADRSRAHAQSREGFQRAHVAVPGASSRRGRRWRRHISDAARGRSATSPHRSADGSSKASLTRSRPGRNSNGSARAWSAAARIITAVSRSASPITIFTPTRATASARTGPSLTTMLRRTTKRPSASSASPGPSTTSAALPTASSSRRLRLACTRVLVQRACGKLNIPCVANRMAVITTPLNGRPPCHYCGQCGRGCVTASNYSSSQVQVFPAMKTGRVKLFTNAMARELIMDSNGKVDGRIVHRQRHAHGAADPLPQRGGRRRRLRIGAAAAQLQILALPQRRRERFRRGGPLSHRYGRLRPQRADSGADRHRRNTTPTAWAACMCSCRGGCGTKRTRSFRAAITSRSAADSACRNVGAFHGVCHAKRRLWREPQEGDSRRLRHVRPPRRPRRDDSQQRYFLRDRSRPWWTATASPCCASISNGATTN